MGTRTCFPLLPLTRHRFLPFVKRLCGPLQQQQSAASSPASAPPPSMAKSSPKPVPSPSTPQHARRKSNLPPTCPSPVSLFQRIVLAAHRPISWRPVERELQAQSHKALILSLMMTMMFIGTETFVTQLVRLTYVRSFAAKARVESKIARTHEDSAQIALFETRCGCFGERSYFCVRRA